MYLPRRADNPMDTIHFGSTEHAIELGSWSNNRNQAMGLVANPPSQLCLITQAQWQGGSEILP